MAEEQAIRLLIATHTLGYVTPAYAQSLATACGYLGAWGIAHAAAMFEDSDVSRGRNAAAAAFMAGDFTHLLFIDGDIEFKPEHVLWLLQTGLPFVVGGYRKKNDRGEWAFVHDWDEAGRVKVDADTGCIRIRRAGTGFMLLAREVFEAIRESTPDLAYVVRKHDGEHVPMHRYFQFDLRCDPFPDLREEWSEDCVFCQRWRDVGGDVWLHPQIQLGHWGPNVWTGSVYDQLQPAPANETRSAAA